MRWEELFADLEAQAEALATAERAAEVDERTRIEVGGLALIDRLGAALGGSVQVRAAGGLAVAGTLVRLGADWLLVDEGGGRESLLALGAVRWVGGLGRTVTQPGAGGVVRARLTMRHALRGLARDRAPVRVQLVDGDVLDATLDRVGADFVDLALHAAGEVRRRDAVRGTASVALSAVAGVRRAG